MGTQTIRIKCAKCGSQDFKHERRVQDDLKPDDIVTCARCGASGKYGQIIEDAKQMIVDDISSHFRKLFK